METAGSFEESSMQFRIDPIIRFLICDWRAKWCWALHSHWEVSSMEKLLDRGTWYFWVYLDWKATNVDIGIYEIEDEYDKSMVSLQSGTLIESRHITGGINIDDNIFVMKSSGRFGRIEIDEKDNCTYVRLSQTTYESRYYRRHFLNQNWTRVVFDRGVKMGKCKIPFIKSNFWLHQIAFTMYHSQYDSIISIYWILYSVHWISNWISRMKVNKVKENK